MKRVEFIQELATQPISWPNKINHVPKEIFVRTDVFEEELKRIFYGEEWHAVAHEAEIPEKGDFKTVKIGRVPLLVTRDKDDEINVLFNACSHRSTQIETAPSGNKLKFNCPYHQWTFDPKGNLIGCPARPGDFPDSFRREDYPLKRPRVGIVHGLIFVTFSPDTPSLDDYLSGWHDQIAQTMGGDGRLRLLGYQKVVFKANWKAYSDNDSYHAPLLHAAFRLLQWQGGRGIQWADERGHRGFTTALTLPSGETTLKDGSLIAYLDKDAKPKSISAHLFPATSLVKHLDSIGIRFANPLSADETELHYAYFSRIDDDEEMTEHRLRQSSNLLGPCGMVSMEDAAVFHRLHIGSHTPGSAIFQKGVKDESVMPTEFSQNDEASNLPGWERYRQIMGYAKEQA